MAGDLCVLACGRTRMPVARENSAIFAMLRSSASRSTTSAGVSISAMAVPISAGGWFMDLPEVSMGKHTQLASGLQPTRKRAASTLRSPVSLDVTVTLPYGGSDRRRVTDRPRLAAAHVQATLLSSLIVSL